MAPNNKLTSRCLRSFLFICSFLYLREVLSLDCPLCDILQEFEFKNNGTISRNSTFVWRQQCALYRELDNVSLARYSWGGGAPARYPYLYESVPCSTGPASVGYDRPLMDFVNFEITTENYTICEMACCAEPSCLAWVYAIAPGDDGNCSAGSPCCYLKDGIPSPVANPICTSGVVNNTQVPPSGLRSAVPLGGLGAGSVEIRGDGTFHDWTIVNQSPGGAVKFSVLDEAVLGFRVSSAEGVVSKQVRTHPPAADSTYINKTFPSLKKIHYSGAYPLSRWIFEDDDLPFDMSLFGFSSLQPSYQNASGTPAITFSLLSASNPNSSTGNSHPSKKQRSGLRSPSASNATISLFFVLPFGIEYNHTRPGPVYKNTTSSDALSCYSLCYSDEQCQSWEYQQNNVCWLRNGVPLNQYQQGAVSGVKGYWSNLYDSDGTLVGLTLNRPGPYPTSGNLTLRALNTAVSAGKYNVTTGFGFNLTWLWQQYEQMGGFPQTNVSQVSATHAAITVEINIEDLANFRETNTMAMAWYFPNRDDSGTILGNFYANLFGSSEQVAQHAEADLANTLQRLDALHRVFYDNTLPSFLQDTLLNSMSHFRSAMWFTDGRWRQWEAYDCNDVDSVHNDAQRELPYMLLFPETTINKLFTWAKFQLPNGMIQEYLEPGCLGPTGPGVDVAPGGRVMGDVSSMFVLLTYAVYKWTGDTDVLQQLWPAAQKALQWQMDYANTTLPAYLTNTYDILNLQNYQYASFNAFLYISSLTAGEALVSMMTPNVHLLNHDSPQPDIDPFLQLLQQKKALALDALHKYLWTGSFYRAFWDISQPNNTAVMADTLYGQVWAYSLGLGSLVDDTLLNLHLKKEFENNYTPNGLLVLTGRNTQPASSPPTYTPTPTPAPGDECSEVFDWYLDNAIWMGGSPDWSTLQIQLGNTVSDSLKLAKEALDHWRFGLNDQWNFHGLIGGTGFGMEGQPWCTSHYGFHMVLWHIPLAISGQNYTAPEKRLEFNPRVEGPYVLPVLIPNHLGLLYADVAGKTVNYTLSLLVGQPFNLSFLSVSGSMFPITPIYLEPGQNVSWTA